MNVCRRRAFDVEATFAERRRLIKTTVDADERGRWEALSAWRIG
jgi:hypothetical protein